MHITVPDVDAAVDRAVAAGATVLRQPSDEPHGRAGTIRDPFGHRWSVATSMLNGVFVLDQPAGYADAQTQTCDWHFTAKQAGSQDLTIAMAPNCQASKECLQAIVAYDMTLTATA